MGVTPSSGRNKLPCLARLGGNELSPPYVEESGKHRTHFWGPFKSNVWLGNPWCMATRNCVTSNSRTRNWMIRIHIMRRHTQPNNHIRISVMLSINVTVHAANGLLYQYSFF